MSDTTAELALALAVDSDDTANYLVTALRNSLNALDGTYNQSTGHNHAGAHQGGLIGAAALVDGSVPGTKLQDGTVTYAKLAANMIESLFAGTYATPNTNYGVAGAVMFVFCNAAITVTLPGVSINRPITITAVSGQVTVAAASGGVIGGSINTSTGAVMNGICSSGDSLTFKSDGANWRVV